MEKANVQFTRRLRARSKQRNHFLGKRPGQSGGTAQASPPIAGLSALQMALVVFVKLNLAGCSYFDPLFESFVGFLFWHAQTPPIYFLHQELPADGPLPAGHKADPDG